MNAAAPRQRAATAAVLSAMAAVVLDAGMVGVALPTIAAALGETPARTLAVVTAYQAALLIALLPCAHVAQRFGYRRLFAGGLALFACASILSAIAPTLGWLVAARFFQGIGGAAIMSLGIALLRFALEPERLGAAIAWNALTVAICSAAAPAVGALLLSVADWPWIFVAAAPVAALGLVAARFLPPVAATSRSLDLAGIAFHASAAGFVVVALALAPARPALAAVLGAVAAASAWRLFARERGKAPPLVPFDLLGLRPFRASVAASIFFFTAQSAGLLALPFYLQLGLGRSAAATGLTLALWPLAVAATSRAANWLATRFSSASICAAGGLVLAAGLVLGASWPIQDSIAPLGACAILCGIGFGLFQVPNNRTMFLSAPAERSAAAGGMQATARLAGQTAGALLVGFVLSAAPAATAPRLALAAAAFAALAAAWIGGAPLRSCGKAGRVRA
ncbi:MAG TPA: MFS transporter [Allosphingosinicella sp.]|nr:MFS transporter [Allosphingosinicella sp.]